MPTYLATLRAFFRVKHPLRDWSFYAALCTSLGVLIPAIAQEWTSKHFATAPLFAGVAPITAWLAQHGYRQAKGAAAAASVLAATLPRLDAFAATFPELAKPTPDVLERLRSVYEHATHHAEAEPSPAEVPAAPAPPQGNSANGSTDPSQPLTPLASEHIEDYTQPAPPPPASPAAPTTEPGTPA